MVSGVLTRPRHAAPDADVPPGDVALGERPLEVVERDLLSCASRLFAVEARFLALVAEFDRRGGWVGEGVRSCAHWLSWRCGISLHAARERVRVARALGDLPRLSEAFASGRISYSKVRAVTRVATPADDASWLDIAESGTATQVERIAAGCARALAEHDRDDGDRDDGADGSDCRRAETGEVRLRYLPDGRVELIAVLTAEDAELVMQGMLAASTADAAGDRAAGSSGDRSGGDRSGGDGSDGDRGIAARRYPVGSLPGRCARGLRGLADSYLAHGPGERDNGATHLVVVQVDADVLAQARDPEPYEVGRLATTGRRLGGHVLRRLACDASIQAAVTGADGEVAMGRRRRLVSTRQRRALDLRDGGCVFPSCTERRWVDAHHVQHWADGGPTVLSNLVLLCRFHHTTVHDGGFGIDLVDGRAVVRRPDGSPLPAAPRLRGAAAGQDVTGPVTTEPLVSEPSCRWSGDALDLRWAVASMCDEVMMNRRPRWDVA